MNRPGTGLAIAALVGLGLAAIVMTREDGDAMPITGAERPAVASTIKPDAAAHAAVRMPAPREPTPVVVAVPAPPPATPMNALPAVAPVLELDGRWFGEIRGGPDEFLQFTFDIRVVGDAIAGTAVFPIGRGEIVEGRLQGNRLVFTTLHRMPATGQVVVSRFEGEATEREIALQVQSEGGRGNLTVNRIR